MTPRPHGIPGTLDRATRERALHRLTDRRYDVLVVGGGVTGAGVALDAASRGLLTALVERVDLAATASLYVGVARMLVAVGVEVEPEWALVLDAHPLPHR